MQSLRRFLAQRPDGPLFHYTGAAGLLGIFQRKEIWATDALYMNDAEELRHADKVLRQEYHARLANRVGPQEDKAMFLSGLEALERRQQQHDSAQIYVVSFSSHGDQLSQWRAYCQGGDGFSIGFTCADLKFALSASKFLLVKCVYDPDEQRGLVRACMDYSIPRLKWARKIAETEQLIEPEKRKGVGFRLEWRLNLWFSAVLFSIKHPSFEEESEWRLVGYGHQQRFRPGRFAIVCYSAIPLCTSTDKPSFAKVYVGPNAEPGLAKQAVQSFLGSYAAPSWERYGSGLASNTHKKIVSSGVPYRY